MLLYLYGKEEGLIQHFLIKSFKSLQIFVPHYPFTEKNLILSHDFDKEKAGK